MAAGDRALEASGSATRPPEQLAAGHLPVPGGEQAGLPRRLHDQARHPRQAPQGPADDAITGLIPTIGCPVPVCRNPVDDPRQVCRSCQIAFGDYLRPAITPPAAEDFTAAEARSSRRLAEVMAERRAPADEWRRNQECWCCEQRCSCRPDPDQPGRCICQNCEAIQ
jgi:hypothetical protein